MKLGTFAKKMFFRQYVYYILLLYYPMLQMIRHVKGDAKEQKFNSYCDILKQQYIPNASDLKYISSILETDIHITDKTIPKDVPRVLMTKDEFDFTSAYYYVIRKMEIQEELQKLTVFFDKHNIFITDSLKKDMDELKSRIKHYESRSIIGNNKI